MQQLAKRLVDGSQLTTSAAEYYKTPANTSTIIRQATLTNTTGTAQTATIHLVPSGGSATASNMILSARTIAPGESYPIYSAQGQVLAGGGTIQALSSAATSITLVASGVEVVQ